MKTLTVNVGKSYEILIDRGLLKQAGALVSRITKAKRIAIITDSNVASLYESTLKLSLEKAGFTVFTHIFPAGESSKNLSSISEMLEFMAEKGLDRKDLVVALGGGVCGDMAGYAAASYLRGIDFVQIPTTLLAQIDSSVGGKTGVDLPQGKNLCGAFHQPILVIIDPDVLSTLSDKYFADGMGEAIKYGCIKSQGLFEKLEKESAKDFVEQMIFECVDIKRQVVENDEKEQGERALLNFGHTFGHAIEKFYNFRGFSHGEAISIGMVMAAKIGEEMAVTDIGTAERISRLLTKYDLPNSASAPFEKLIVAMGADKKRDGDNINFVLLNSVGSSFIHSMKMEQFQELRRIFQ